MSETSEETGRTGEAPLRQALRGVPLLADLADAEIDWLAENAEEIHLADGEVISREGEPAERMSIVLAGELRGRGEKGSAASAPSSPGPARSPASCRSPACSGGAPPSAPSARPASP